MLRPDIFYQMPDWIQRLYKGVEWRGDTSRKVVYLTFDDGPFPEVTPKVLEILKKYDALATFFMVGENALKYPELTAAVSRNGHRIGNHTQNHIKGTMVTTGVYMYNVGRADWSLGSCRLFRPPYGRLRRHQRKALLDLKYRIILWDVLTHDYDPAYTPEMMLNIVKKYTRNGSIINFHDSLKSNERMLTVLPQVLEFLQSEGYTTEIL